MTAIRLQLGLQLVVFLQQSVVLSLDFLVRLLDSPIRLFHSPQAIFNRGICRGDRRSRGGFESAIVAGFASEALAVFGPGTDSGFGAEGVEAGLLASEAIGDCPRTVAPKLTRQIMAPRHRPLARRVSMTPSIMRFSRVPGPASSRPASALPRSYRKHRGNKRHE